MSSNTQVKLYASRYELTYCDGRVGIFIDRVQVHDSDGKFLRDAQLHKLIQHLEGRALEFAPLPDHKQLRSDRASYKILMNYDERYEITALDKEIIIEQLRKDYSNLKIYKKTKAVFWYNNADINGIIVSGINENDTPYYITTLPNER
jgi:hypothetical protein